MKRPSSFSHSSLVDEITDNFRDVSKEALICIDAVMQECGVQLRVSGIMWRNSA